MTTFFLCALLLSNVFLVGLLLVRPNQQPTQVKNDEPPPDTEDAQNQEENIEIVKIVKVAVHEAVPEVLKVLGRFCDADPADIEEPVKKN